MAGPFSTMRTASSETSSLVPTAFVRRCEGRCSGRSRCATAAIAPGEPGPASTTSGSATASSRSGAWAAASGSGLQGPAACTGTASRECLKAPAPERPRDEFLRRYGAWFDPVPALIESTAQDAIEPTFTYDRRPRRTWGRGRVTLLGDAAHPMKPNIGQGAAQALEDAVVLGSCIAGMAEPEDALRAYERRRVRRASTVVRASRQAGRVAEVRSPVVARTRDAVMKAMPDR